MSQLQQSDFAGTCQNNTVRPRECRSAPEKQVSVEISPEDLRALKNGKYKLCFARKIAEGDYNVVWQAFDKYLCNNVFSWMSQYQLFGSIQFNAGAPVVVSTNYMTIGLGETTLLSSTGMLQPPISGGSATGFTMNNEYGSIHVGVNQLCTQLDGLIVSSPMYVSAEAVIEGSVTLTPVEKVLIWFQQNITAGAIFSEARTGAIEFDLTEINSMKCLFKDQKWITVA